MKTRLERELQRVVAAVGGTAWDGLRATLWATAMQKENSKIKRLRVLIALFILPQGKPNVQKK